MGGSQKCLNMISGKHFEFRKYFWIQLEWKRSQILTIRFMTEVSWIELAHTIKFGSWKIFNDRNNYYLKHSQVKTWKTHRNIRRKIYFNFGFYRGRTASWLIRIHLKFKLKCRIFYFGLRIGRSLRNQAPIRKKAQYCSWKCSRGLRIGCSLWNRAPISKTARHSARKWGRRPVY